ncbi:hypothetical protein BHM03_00058708, partial [Ensete ventricosum]
MEAEMRSLRWPSMMRERWSKVTLRETATETKRKERERMRRPAFLAMPAASVCYSSCGRPSAGFIEGQGCGRKAGEERARQLRTSNPVMSPGNRGNCSCVDDHHFPCMRVSSAGDWGKPKGTGKAAMSVQVRVACPIQDGIQLLSPNYYSASGTHAPYVLPYLKPVSIGSSRSYPRADHLSKSDFPTRSYTTRTTAHPYRTPYQRQDSGARTTTSTWEEEGAGGTGVRKPKENKSLLLLTCGDDKIIQCRKSSVDFFLDFAMY